MISYCNVFGILSRHFLEMGIKELFLIKFIESGKMLPDSSGPQSGKKGPRLISNYDYHYDYDLDDDRQL